jgi:tRNA pseudouridine38-40 synthase
MKNILLTVSYDGTNFCGWQRQDNTRTVQGEIEKVLEKIHKQQTDAQGSGRTDSGVHAVGQTVTFISPIDNMNPENYIPAMNSLLPQDIRVVGAKEVPMDFSARFNATSRTYRYFINCSETPMAHQMPYSWAIRRQPDINKLNRMASCLYGELDCTTFAYASDLSPSKFRYIEKAIFYPDGDFLVFEITANAFLWKMVRSITGSLIEFEKKGFDESYFKQVLESKNRKLAGFTAPPQGLFLWSVSYEGKRRHV